MGYGLGVDLGTTFTGAAVSHHGRTRIVALSDLPVPTPAVPQPHADHLVRAELLVRAGPAGVHPEPGLAEPVPLVLGGRPHRGDPVLAGALRSVLQSVTTAAQGETPEKIVLTCPAVWGPVRRRQFAEVSRQAGLGPVTVVSEPEAATAHFAGAARLAEGDVVAVYDLGAVTVDMTVVRVTDSGTEILGQPEALEGVGGVDFDDVVLAHVDGLMNGALSGLNLDDPVAVGVLEGARAECVRAKEALSWAQSTTVAVGFATDEVRVGLSRVEFESMIRAGLESTLTGLRRSMLSAGVEAADLAAVVLVGGSSRIPLVERILVNGLGRPLLVPDNPQHCVALGAAALAEGFAASARAVPSAPTQPIASSSSASASVEAPAVAPTRRAGDTAPHPDGHPRDRRRMLALAVTTALLLAWGTYFAVGPLLRAPQSAAEAALAGPSSRAGSSAGSSGARASGAGVGAATSSPAAVVTPIAVPIRKATPAPTVPAAATGTGALIGPAGKCLDVQGAQNADGTPVQLYPCNGTDAQLWSARPDGSLRALGRCLQSTSDGLVISHCTGRAGQRWQVVSGGIHNPRSKQCVAVLGAPNDLAPVTATGCRRQPGQRWKLSTT